MKLSKQQIKWILLAQCGNIKAFDELLKSIQYPLYRYISRLTGENILAEDILQEVFLLVYRKLKWLQNPELFYPWLYRLAARKTFKTLKKERKLWKQEHIQNFDDSFLESIPDTSNEEKKYKDFLDEFPALLNKTSPASRAVLVLHYSEGMKLSQISEILELNLGTVKSRLAYGLAALRETIKSEKNLAHFLESTE